MKVYCSHKERGCEWIGELGKLSQHLNIDQEMPGCLFQSIECSFCNESIQRQNIGEHKSDKCPKRPYSCDYCNNYESTCEDVTTNHWPVCPSRPVPCPNKCGMYPEQQALDTHIDQECPLAIIDCSFRYAGCREKLCRKDMADHVATTLAMHMSLQADNHHQELQKLQEQIKQQNEIIMEQQRDFQEQLIRQNEIIMEQKRELEEHKRELKLKEHVGIVPLSFIVPNYSKLKKSNAVWQSKPFYSHAHGYKLSLHVAPNGNGEAIGTHISVFINLMKGEFDEELHWPLRGKMNILLVDNELDDLFQDFISFQYISFVDEKSDKSFARVTDGEEAKHGWGNRKFMSHSSLGTKYLKHDCLHFKIQTFDLY